MKNRNNYRTDIDALKGISIIVVVLFHLGLLKSGYLGVDAFFVINGFLIVPSLVKHIENNEFRYFSFICRRSIRLLPLIVLASFVTWILGYFLMLPDHFENACQAIIATNFMSENILSAITTKNYWDQGNDFKPLMHFWYIGILFEFYVTTPLFLLASHKLSKVFHLPTGKTLRIALLVLVVTSLILYLAPVGTSGDKFYYLQYRFFEIGMGGLVGLYPYRFDRKISVNIAYRFFVLLFIGVLCCSLFYTLKGVNVNTAVVIGKPLSNTTGLPISPQLALLCTVILTSVLLSFKTQKGFVINSKVLRHIGTMSYSIFVWHQVILAYYRYAVTSEKSLITICVFILFVYLVSYGSYNLVEKKIKASKKTYIIWFSLSIMVILPSVYMYLKAGIVRDIPELEVYKTNTRRGLFAEYCDRVYKYKEFPKEDNNKTNVLVVGVSFGRDFANVLLESSYKDSINLVYAFKWDESGLEDVVKRCDYIFSFSKKDALPQFVWNSKKQNCKVIGISTKNFGTCNGIIYSHRGEQNYLQQTAEIVPGYKELNEEWKESWGEDNYIDMLSMAMVDDNHVRVFTDDGHFISQDCSHLMPAGARWYASIIDWKNIFN